LDESPRVGGLYGPYKQSERLSHYWDVANQLIDSSHAYKCFCKTEVFYLYSFDLFIFIQKRLDILRKKCLSEKTVPRYDGHCRSLSDSEVISRERNGEHAVIRFKFEPGEMTFKVILLIKRDS
jgi:nondiscriminating glutamyl-tRNA synthetase